MDEPLERVLESLSKVTEASFFPNNLSFHFNNVSEFLSIDITNLISQGCQLNDYWFDDTILTRLSKSKDVVSIWGVAILGVKTGGTEQWTAPFFCQINGKKHQVKIYFGDQENPFIRYIDYVENRGLWDVDFYMSDDWNPSERAWAYRIP